MQQILERELTACENDDEDQQNEDSRDIDNDGFNEIDDMQQPGCLDTLLDDPDINATNKPVFAPGEGQRPLGIFQDPDAEYLSFPTIYCGQRRIENFERPSPVHYSDICKWELRHVDRRVALSVPNPFI